MISLGSLKIGDYFRHNGSLCMVAGTAPPRHAHCIVYDLGTYSGVVDIHQYDEVEFLGNNPTVIGVKAS